MKIKKRKVLLSVKCFEHFFEASPNKLAAFKLVANSYKNQICEFL